jgi:drug/metabolite transporter superfamily protein YnfA
MSWQILIMYGVAAVFSIVGAYMLLALLRPAGPAKVYVFRMVGIMALAAGIVLAMSATAMWQWSAPG